MLLRAIALFVILNTIFIETESQISPWHNGRECLVIKDTKGRYLSVNREKKLVLDKHFDRERSTFRFESTGRLNKQRLIIYRIVNCGRDRPLIWSNQAKANSYNFFVFAKNAHRFGESQSWVVVSQVGSRFVQIVDAQSGLFNLYSSSTKEDGKKLALLYGAAWPTSFDQKENNKPFWTIEYAPRHHGGRHFDGSPVLDAVQSTPDTDDGSEETTPDDTSDENTTPDLVLEDKQERTKSLAITITNITDFTEWTPNPNTCYVISQVINGQTYSLNIGTTKGTRLTAGIKLVMDKVDISKAKSWRFVLSTTPSAPLPRRYKLMNCVQTSQILTVGHMADNPLNNGEIGVSLDGDYSLDMVLWIVHKNVNDGRFLITEFFAQSESLYVQPSADTVTAKEIVSDFRTKPIPNEMLFNFVEYAPYP